MTPSFGHRAVIWDPVCVYRELGTGAYSVVGAGWGDSAWTKQVGQLHSMLEGSVWHPGGLEHVAVLDRVDKMTFEQSAEGDQGASHIGMCRGSVSR